MKEDETPPETLPDLTRLHPDHVKVTRIVASIFMAILAVPVVLIEAGQVASENRLLPMGSVAIPFLIIAAFLIIRLPMRRYIMRGFDMGADRIRIVRGLLFHVDTIVPFGRIQHIDVDQGPIQRRYSLATLTLHTAGNHNSQVSLPGLLHEDAIAMREEIRAHIRRDTL